MWKPRHSCFQNTKTPLLVRFMHKAKKICTYVLRRTQALIRVTELFLRLCYIGKSPNIPLIHQVPATVLNLMILSVKSCNYFPLMTLIISLNYFLSFSETSCGSMFATKHGANSFKVLHQVLLSCFPDHKINSVKIFVFVSRLLPESTGGVSNSRQEGESGAQPPHTQRFSCYDLDDLDVAWLELVNHEFKQMGECKLKRSYFNK